MSEVKLMKGNEAIAEAAMRAGVDAYFGYPITPQSEILEYLTQHNSDPKEDMVVLQAESEVAAINMVYGAAAAGKKAFTSSSSPGLSLKQEGISYIACAELPCLIVNVVRGGPGLGTIQPAQSDYFQSVKGGGHGDYKLIVLAPASVQEMADFVALGFDLAFKHNNPVMIQADGIIGQMMEKVEFPVGKPRDHEIDHPWAANGKKANRDRRFVNTLVLESTEMEKINIHLQNKYNHIKETETRYEEYKCEDADYILVAYGSSARISKKAVDIGREKGIKLGLLRPITLFPFPEVKLQELAKRVKGFLSVEMSAGQMVEDVKLAVNGKVPVEHYGRYGGVVHTPAEVLNAAKKQLMK